MKNEIIFFRLMLLIATASFGGFGGSALYYFYDAEEAHSYVRQWSKDYGQKITACGKSHPYSDVDFDICKGNFAFLKEGLDSSADHYNASLEKYSFFFNLAYIIPAVAIFLYYGGRWVLFGRLRPFIPRL